MLTKWIKVFLVFSISISTSISSYAISWSNWWHNKMWHPIATIGGGVSISSDIGESKNFPILNPTTDEFYYYTINSATQTSGLLDAFLGAEWNLRPNWALQAGIGYNQASPFSASGTFVQGADVETEDTYNYRYGILLRQLLIEGKLLYSIKEYFHPYVLVGLGAAFNKAYNYYTTVPRFLTFTRMYSNNSTTSFSYALGIGLDYDVTSQIRLGLGYRFADLGKVELGSAVIDTTSVSGTLSQSNLYTNEVLVQFTWVV